MKSVEQRIAEIKSELAIDDIWKGLSPEERQKVVDELDRLQTIVDDRDEPARGEEE